MNTQMFTNEQMKGTHYAFGDLLSTQDREYLVENSHIKIFNKGDVLCRQNRIEDVLYVILMGEVEVIEEHTDETRSMPIGKLYTGDLVGEIAALFTVPRIASVYLGGGTPSLLEADEINRLFDRPALAMTICPLEYPSLLTVCGITMRAPSPSMGRLAPAASIWMVR